MPRIICYTFLVIAFACTDVWARDLTELEDVSIKVIGLDRQESQDAEIIDLPDPNFEEFRKNTAFPSGTPEIQDGNEITAPIPSNSN